MIFDSGDTSKSIHVFIADDAGAPVTGLTYLTAPTISYWISGNNAAVPVTLADLAALTTAWTSGGFKEIGVGMYRLDIPNAALASAGMVLIYGGTSGKQMYPVTISVAPKVNTTKLNGTSQTGRDIGASVLLSSGTGAGQLSLSSGAVLLQATQTGVTIPNVTTVGSVSGNVGGNVTGSVGSVVGAVTTSNASDVTAIKSKTDQLTFTVSNKVDATADVDASSIATDVLTTQMTEDYAAEGAAPTLAQAIMLLLQREFNVSISGQTMTVKKLDGSTTAATITLNSSTEPTSITRAT